MTQIRLRQQLRASVVCRISARVEQVRRLFVYEKLNDTQKCTSDVVAAPARPFVWLRVCLRDCATAPLCVPQLWCPCVCPSGCPSVAQKYAARALSQTAQQSARRESTSSSGSYCNVGAERTQRQWRTSVRDRQTRPTETAVPTAATLIAILPTTSQSASVAIRCVVFSTGQLHRFVYRQTCLADLMAHEYHWDTQHKHYSISPTD